MADLPVPNPSQQTEVVSAALSVKTFEGPLPPPSALRDYEDICSGAAERILVMAENQARHRQELESKLTDAGVEHMRRGFGEARLGQVLAFTLSTAFLGAGAYVSLMGQPWVGGLLGGMGLSSIVAAFISGRNQPAADDPAKKRKVTP